MHKSSVLAIAAMFIAGSIVPALAVQPTEDTAQAAQSAGSAVKNAAEAAGHAVKSGAEAVGHGVKEGAKATGRALGITSAEQGEHRTTGTISSIDHNKGLLSLDTTGGQTLRVHFPPPAVRQLNKGDQITVELAFAKTAPKEESEHAYDAPKAEKSEHGKMGEHWMKGSVSGIDHEKGMFNLKTKEGTLALAFPPSSISNLKDGDRIAVELAYFKGNPEHPETNKKM